MGSFTIGIVVGGGAGEAGRHQVGGGAGEAGRHQLYNFSVN